VAWFRKRYAADTATADGERDGGVPLTVGGGGVGGGSEPPPEEPPPQAVSAREAPSSSAARSPVACRLELSSIISPPPPAQHGLQHPQRSGAVRVDDHYAGRRDGTP